MSRDQRNWRRLPAPVSMLAAIPGLRCYQKDVDDGHLMVLEGWRGRAVAAEAEVARLRIVVERAGLAAEAGEST